MTFSYAVYNAFGTLVTTVPTLRLAVELAQKYGGYVVKEGQVMFRAKSKLKGDDFNV